MLRLLIFDPCARPSLLRMDTDDIFAHRSLWCLLQIKVQVLQNHWLTPVDSNHLALASSAARTVWWSWIRREARERLRLIAEGRDV